MTSNSAETLARRSLFVAVGLVAAWRVVQLDARSLWFDEAFSWQITRFSWGEMLQSIREDVHPPLYYFVLKLWIGVFDDSVFAMRSLSVAWFGLTLAGAFLLCREVCESEAGDPGARPGLARRDDAGWIALMLVSASPILFRFSQEARMYSQMAALAILSQWLFLLGRRVSALSAWAGYVIATASLAYTHYFGLLLISAHAAHATGLPSKLSWLATWRRSTSPGRDNPALVAISLVGIIFIIWTPTLLAQQSRVAADYWTPRVDEQHSPIHPDAMISLVSNILFYRDGEVSVFSNGGSPDRVVGVVLLGLACSVPIACARRFGDAGLILASAMVLPPALAIGISTLSGRNLLEIRFFLPSFVVFLCGTALLLSAMPTAPRLLLGSCLVLNFCAHTYSNKVLDDHSQEFEMITRAIDRLREPGEMVICTHPSNYFPMKYHARARFEVKQLRDPRLRITHYSGAPILRDRDYADIEEVRASEKDRIFVQETRHDDAERLWPESWRRIESMAFPNRRLSIRGELFLRIYRIDRGAGLSLQSTRDPQWLAARYLLRATSPIY